jgi:methionyl-tRNA formyltransferase
LEGTPTKNAALEAGLKIYQPQNTNTEESIEFLKTLNADLFVVIAYGQILSQEILDIPKIFSINLHASLLPKYRGAAPINWAIIRGEKTTGVTVIKMTARMDAGAIIMQKETAINNEDTAVTLEDKLSNLGAQALLESLTAIEDNKFNLTAQDERGLSFAPKLKKKDGLINWKEPAGEISNLIRGCLGWPGAFTYYKGKLLKIYKAEVSLLPQLSSPPPQGEIIKVDKSGIVVAAGDGGIIIEELQIEGSKRMNAEEFVAGHKVLPGEKLCKK